jgi:hypothetical protein
MEMPEWVKHVQENIAHSNIKPMFADEALVMGSMKVRKDEKGKMKKEGMMRVVFVDMTNMQPIASIAISISTAHGLINALSGQLKKIEEDLASKDLPKKPKTPDASLTYIG